MTGLSTFRPDEPGKDGEVMRRTLPGQGSVLRFRINDWVPDRRLGLNGRNRTHWHVIRKCKDETKQRVRMFLDRYPGTKEVRFDHARVIIEFEFTQKRRRDPDNLAGLTKPIMDALVAAGILVDDDCDHVDLTIRARATGQYATIVEISGTVAAEVPEQAPLEMPAPKPRRAPRRVVDVLEGLPY